MRKMMGLVTVVSGIVALAGCWVEGNGGAPAAPAVEDDGLSDQATRTLIADGGTWTGTAQTPVLQGSSAYPNRRSVSASAVFTGPGSFKMGVCALQLTQLPCTGIPNQGETVKDAIDRECGSLSIPSGGGRYCTAQNDVGQKYCAIRPGAQSAYCAGSPTTCKTSSGASCECGSPNCGPPQTVAPGTLTTPVVSAPLYSNWISYACFDGCKSSDPSSSSAVLNDCNPSAFRYNSCINSGFTWYWDTCQCQP